MSHVIDIASDALEVRVLSLGATLAGVRFAGDPRNLVLGFADPADHARIPAFAGHLAGPIANRVRAGRVEIDGVVHQMALNEAGRTALHSGPHGINTVDWQIADQQVDRVTLTCDLTPGAQGLPGHRHLTATYALEGTTLKLTITATSDAPTPINIASHPYWNLDGAPDVSGHTLEVATDQYLPTDTHNLPTGEIAPLKGPRFDFGQPRAVPLDAALDLNYCLSDHMRAAPQPAATLRGSDGTTLVITTTCPGLQVYAGAHLPREDVAMADFPPLAPFAGIALEPQHWPDAPHHGHFPAIILRPDETYRQITAYHLSRA